jgi:amino acid transporter
MLFALGWPALITILNILGLKLGKWLDNFCAMGAWIPGAVLLALAATFARHFGSATRFSAAQFVPHADLRNVIFWSTIFFAFGGDDGVEAFSLSGCHRNAKVTRTQPSTIRSKPRSFRFFEFRLD